MDYKQLWHKVITRLQEIDVGDLDLTEATIGVIRIEASALPHLDRSLTCKIAAKNAQGDGQVTLSMNTYPEEVDLYEITAAVNENEPEHVRFIKRVRSINDSFLKVIAVLNIKPEPSPRLADIIVGWITDCISKRQQHLLDRAKRHQLETEEEQRKHSALRERALAGDKSAQQELGAMWVRGREYLEWLETAAKEGHAESQYLLGVAISELGSFKESCAARLEWWTKAANQAHAEAAYGLAKFHRPYDATEIEYGDEPPFCRPGAIEGEDERWLMRAAELGHEEALCDLAGKFSDTVRKIAEKGHLRAIKIMAKLAQSPEESFAWHMRGAELGDAECQMLVADSLRHGRGIPASIALSKQRYAYCSRLHDYNRSREALNLLGNLHLEGSNEQPRDVLRAVDAWQRSGGWRGKVRDYDVVVRASHIIVSDGGTRLILDTGSSRSPRLEELDASYPGIQAHIRKLLGGDVVGIFGNDKLLSGEGFVLDLRDGDRGKLWIAEPHSQKASERLPCVDLALAGESHRAFVDTGAHISYLRSMPERYEPAGSMYDYSVLGGRFEKFSVHTANLKVNSAKISRKIRFGELPTHLAESTFRELGADAIIGTAMLEGAILSWTRKDNVCLIEDAAHAELASLFIGTDLNRLLESPASLFEAYYLGWHEPHCVSFRQDLMKIVPPEHRFETSSGVKSGWLIPEYFQGGGQAEHLKGRHRTMFVIACYFSVLIDQAFHHHFRAHHDTYERLVSTPKFNITGPNVHPGHLLKAANLRDDPCADSAFREAIPVVENQLKALVRNHFEALNPDEVWNAVYGHVPQDSPIFR